MSQALSGLSAWWAQRLSALYLGWYLTVAVLLWLLAPPFDYPRWHHLWALPPVTIASLLFFIALLLHAWVGIRDVILDYAGQTPALRLLLLSLLGGWLLILGAWAALVLLRVALS